MCREKQKQFREKRDTGMFTHKQYLTKLNLKFDFYSKTKKTVVTNFHQMFILSPLIYDITFERFEVFELFIDS